MKGTPREGFQPQGYAVQVGAKWLGPEGLTATPWWWGSRASAERLALAAMREHGTETKLYRRLVERECKGQKDLSGKVACAKSGPTDQVVPNRLLERLRERDRKRGERERAKLQRTEAAKAKRAEKRRQADEKRRKVQAAREEKRKAVAKRKAERAAKRKGITVDHGPAKAVSHTDFLGVPMMDPKAAPKASAAYLVGVARSADRSLYVGSTKDVPDRTHWVLAASVVRAPLRKKWARLPVLSEADEKQARKYLAMPKGAELVRVVGYRPHDRELNAALAVKPIGPSERVWGYFRAETYAALCAATVGGGPSLHMVDGGAEVYLCTMTTAWGALMLMSPTVLKKAPPKGKAKR